MEFFEDLKTHLIGTQSINNDLRSSSEEQIKALRDQDPYKFMATLTREIADETFDFQARMMACLIFKNFITNSSRDPKYEGFWHQMQPDTRVFMKQAIIAQLASEQAQVRQQIANVVAAIASLEVPHQQWPELIQLLSSNSEHIDHNIRMSSLTTLGYLCEEIKPKDLSTEDRSRLIGALIRNITLQAEVDPALPEDVKQKVMERTHVSIRALSTSISFASQNFEIAEQRDGIMAKICQACYEQNEEIVVCALQCLRDISTYQYDNLQTYFTNVCQITQHCITNRSDCSKIGGQAFEFWTTLIEDETERLARGRLCRNYIKSIFENLIDVLLQGISMVKDFDEDDLYTDDNEEWGFSISASLALQKLAILAQDQVMGKIIAFGAENIKSPEWKKRFAGLMALGSIAEGPSKLKFKDEIFLPALPQFLDLFNDPVSKVRQGLSWTIRQFCEFHGQTFQDPNVAGQLLPKIIESIQDKPKISHHNCIALEKLSQACVDQENPFQNPLTPYFQRAISLLMSNCQREDSMSTELRQASFLAMTEMVQNSGQESRQLVFELTIPVLQQLEATVNQPDTVDNKLYQDQLCCILQVCFLKAEHLITLDQQKKIIMLITQLFKQANRVTENGLIAFQGLCLGQREAINISEFGVYLKYALEQQDDDCAKIACGIIQDISSFLKERLNEYLDDFVPHIHNILQSSTIKKIVKISALSALGDLSLNSGSEFNRKYMDQTLGIYQMASQAAVEQDVNPEDVENTEFILALRQELVEQYSLLLVSLSEHADPAMEALFLRHLNHVIFFLEKLTQKKETAQSFNLIREMCNLLLDIAQNFQTNQEMIARLKQPWSATFINYARTMNDKDIFDTTQAVIEILQSGMR